VTSKTIIGTALLALATPALSQAPAAQQNITRAQVQNELTAAFGRVDTNKDGAISVAEANSAQQRTAANAAAEIKKVAQQQFAKLDVDKNGQLSLTEFEAGARKVNVTSGQQIVGVLDAKKDGKVTMNEFQAQRLATFDSIDTNHDGIITPTEGAAASQRNR